MGLNASCDCGGGGGGGVVVVEKQGVAADVNCAVSWGERAAAPVQRCLAARAAYL
jgi:hypothetical protein